MTQHYPGQPQQQGPYGPPQGQHPLSQPRKRRKVWPFVVLGVVLVFVLGFVACTAVVGKAVSDAVPSGTAAKVTYSLEGAGSATTVTYSADGTPGAISQEAKVKMPWSKDVQFAAGSFRVATLTAQNAGSGKLTCRITVDGKVVKEVSSSGQYSVVSCASDAF